MDMKFAVGMGRNENIYQISDLAKTAEDSGFNYVTFVDQPHISPDALVCMTLAINNTERIHVAHGVTDHHTYHPSVTANATACLNELSGGRAFVGIGTGNIGAKVTGISPFQELRDAILFIKKFSAGEEVEFQGLTWQSEWSRRPLRVYLGGTGPRLCQLAGEVADGIMLTSNADPVLLQWQKEQVEIGAAKAGRDPSEVDIWARGMIYVTDTVGQAKREVSGYAVNSAKVLSRLLRQKSAPIEDLRKRMIKAHPKLIEECEQSFNKWRPEQHEKIDTQAALAITQNILDVQHLVGRPDDICEKLEIIRNLGIDTFATVTYTIFDKIGIIQLIGEDIISKFN